MMIPQPNPPFRSSDTGAGHNIIVPQSVAEAYYSQVPGAYLDRIGANLTVWYVHLRSTNPERLQLTIPDTTCSVD